MYVWPWVVCMWGGGGGGGSFTVQKLGEGGKMHENFDCPW